MAEFSAENPCLFIKSVASVKLTTSQKRLKNKMEKKKPASVEE